MKQNDGSTLYLVDGSNYLYRAFYAIGELSSSKGFPTNAVFGFTNMLLKLLREREPLYVGVVFDVKGPTFRHETYADYKATRKPIPDALIPQISVTKEIIKALGIAVLEMQGLEADDIIGTLAKSWASQGFNVVVVSSDKDLLQIVSERICVLDTMRDKCYDAKAVEERFGVPPCLVADVLALMGDTTDNIPGVPGIGQKTAKKLICEFGSLENLLKRVDDVKPPRLQEAIIKNANQARMSYELVRIRTDVGIDVGVETIRRTKEDKAKLLELFRELEFYSLLPKLEFEASKSRGRWIRIEDRRMLELCIDHIREKGICVLDTIPSGLQPVGARILGMVIGIPEMGLWYLPSTVLDDGGWFLLRDVLSDESISKTGHDLKFTHILLKSYGGEIKGEEFDTMIASYVLNPSRRGFDLAELSLEFMGVPFSDTEKETKRICSTGVEGDDLDSALIDSTSRKVEIILQLRTVLEEKLKQNGLYELFRDIEMPLVNVLADMEYHGVLLDVELLTRMSLELEDLLNRSMERIYRLAGERFNVNSPKQLQRILFDKLGLPRGRKTKGGYSTDVEVLTSLAISYELPAEILAYRSLMKLKTTYVDVLPQLVNPKTGRIHTSYNQAVTATGRLSSSNPNLQNIPVRTVEGKRIRRAFIAPEEWWLVSADYSQIELRILAHLSGDKSLIHSFISGEDIHTRTASNLFGVFPEMVDESMRRQAKVINFGIIYGMSPFGLSKELHISKEQAQRYIDEYFSKYEGVKRYIEETLDRARKLGYVQTLFGRRRFLPEINADNASVRQFAERTAINTPIQGTAADIIKIAMIRIARRLKEENLKSKMIMQVHDELVFEVPEAEKDTMTKLVKEEMEHVVNLEVPLRVEIGYGRNWDEAHP
ncbi:MAG: DNA polymerase I [Syntrophales bacterium]|nr:DNA polymerase I [Syntrophales bacterium]